MVIADAVCPVCGEEFEVVIPEGTDWQELTVDCTRPGCGETDMDIVSFDAERKTLTLVVIEEDEQEESDDEDED